MARLLTGQKLVLATHNQGKISEIGTMLAPFAVTVISAADLGLPEPDETGDSFAANASLKALAAAQGSGLPALADDSGLAVAALDGAPGIYSARWAGTHKDFQAAMQRVHDMMGDHADRRAAFVAVLALAWPDGHVALFEGRSEGVLVWPPRGDGGFGYDPIFVPDGDTRSYGEMPPADKRKTSHRARALEQMLVACFDRDASL